MKNAVLQKSSFSLPLEQALLVTRLKKRLRLRSNTEVVRQALRELQKKVDREELRRQFTEASMLVQGANREDREVLDDLAGEGLE